MSEKPKYHLPAFVNWDFGGGAVSIDLSKLDGFVYAGKLSKCQQNQEFHGEGDVWTHTKMVIDRLVHSSDWEQCSSEEQFVLFMAALLHDIAKPESSKIEDGVIRTKKHADLGVGMARSYLWDTSTKGHICIPWRLREAICNLVKLHMLPVRFIDKRDPLWSIAASSYTSANRLLAILAKADTQGRICSENNMKASVSAVEMFESFCKENDCWDKPLPFKSPNARFRYFFENRGHPSIDWAEPPAGNVVMMSGVQGSGKSWTIEHVYPNLPVVGLDETRKDFGVKFGEAEGQVAQETKERARKHMRAKQPFVFNSISLIREWRGGWIRLFRSYQFTTHIHYVERALATTLKQNRGRKSMVPESVIFDRFLNMEIPNLLECHDITYDVGEK